MDCCRQHECDEQHSPALPAEIRRSQEDNAIFSQSQGQGYLAEFKIMISVTQVKGSSESGTVTCFGNYHNKDGDNLTIKDTFTLKGSIRYTSLSRLLATPSLYSC